MGKAKKRASPNLIPPLWGPDGRTLTGFCGVCKQRQMLDRMVITRCACGFEVSACRACDGWGHSMNKHREHIDHVRQHERGMAVQTSVTLKVSIDAREP